MIKDKPKRSIKDPFLLVLAGILVVGASAWQLYLLHDSLFFFPEELVPMLLMQAIEGFYFGALMAVLLFVSSGVMYLANQKIGAVVGLVCSGVGFLVPGSGFIIGPLLGIIAGFDKLMVSKPPEVGDPNEVL
jgi:hypothetical protein